jgi:hypothetical protein
LKPDSRNNTGCAIAVEKASRANGHRIGASIHPHAGMAAAPREVHWLDDPIRGVPIPPAAGYTEMRRQRFFSYQADRDEPPHVHMEREASGGKFRLEPVRVELRGGMA